VDASPAAVEAARQAVLGADRAPTFQVGTAERLPFKAERFDAVLSVTMLCFTADAQAAVAEMVRVLRPGGLLVIGDLGRWSPWAAWRRVRGWAGDSTWGRARFWSLAELQGLMRLARLDPERWRAAAFYPPLGLAARFMAPLDGMLGHRTTLGAAFLAASGRKAGRKGGA
jgi:SAM-dependent methyltransferase